MTDPRTEAGRALIARLGWFASEKGDALREGILAVEAEARTAERADIRAKVEAIDHPCHDVCVGNLHADCQCAAWVRQEAIRAVLGAEKP